MDITLFVGPGQPISLVLDREVDALQMFEILRREHPLDVDLVLHPVRARAQGLAPLEVPGLEGLALLPLERLAHRRIHGPVGVFERLAFRKGTEAVANAVARSEAFTLVGGGDSVAAIELLGLPDQIDHLSTGGGAGLRLLEGRPLPGVVALQR